MMTTTTVMSMMVTKRVMTLSRDENIVLNSSDSFLLANTNINQTLKMAQSIAKMTATSNHPDKLSSKKINYAVVVSHAVIKQSNNLHTIISAF